MCVADFAAFLERAERSPATIRNYACDLRAFAAWFESVNGEELALPKITPTDLRQYKRYLVDERRLKPNSTNRHLATLRCFLKWAAEGGMVSDARALKVPAFEREVRSGPRWLDRRERFALVRAVEQGESARDAAIVKLLLNTGLRVQEMCSLEWHEVTMTERKGVLTVRRGKGGKRRQVPLNADARKALELAGHALYAGKRMPIFMGQRGPLTPRGVQSMICRYAMGIGLDITPHTLRHTFCKDLVNAGVGLEKVAALAGHESMQSTRRYCEPSLKDLEIVVELIGEGP
jgi:integrase/recombinase XerC